MDRLRAIRGDRSKGPTLTGVRIPQEHRDSAAALSKLTDDQMRRLDDELASAPANLQMLVDVMNGYGFESPRTVLDALVGMATTSQLHNIADEDVVAGVLADLGPSSGGQDFSPLLSKKSIRQVAKLFDVGFSHENLLNNVRIFTEVRPIFEEKIDEEFDAAVVTHSMRLSYVANNELREAYFTMDTSDLAAMQAQIERALTKGDAMTRFLRKVGVTPLDEAPPQ